MFVSLFDNIDYKRFHTCRTSEELRSFRALKRCIVSESPLSSVFDDLPDQVLQALVMASPSCSEAEVFYVDKPFETSIPTEVHYENAYLLHGHRKLWKHLAGVRPKERALQRSIEKL